MMQLRNGIRAIVLLTLSQVAFVSMQSTTDVRRMGALSGITKRADSFAKALMRNLPMENRPLEKRQDFCPVGEYECDIGFGCCPTGVDCVYPNLCDVGCTVDDVSCGDGTCCQQGEVCLALTCGVDDGTNEPTVPEEYPTTIPTYSSFDDPPTTYFTYSSSGALLLTVDAMLGGGALGLAVGYLVM